MSPLYGPFFAVNPVSATTVRCAFAYFTDMSHSDKCYKPSTRCSVTNSLFTIPEHTLRNLDSHVTWEIYSWHKPLPWELTFIIPRVIHGLSAHGTYPVTYRLLGYRMSHQYTTSHIGGSTLNEIPNRKCLGYCYLHQLLPYSFVCFRYWFPNMSATHFFMAVRTADAMIGKATGTNVWVNAFWPWSTCPRDRSPSSRPFSMLGTSAPPSPCQWFTWSQPVPWDPPLLIASAVLELSVIKLQLYNDFLVHKALGCMNTYAMISVFTRRPPPPPPVHSIPLAYCDVGNTWSPSGTTCCPAYCYKVDMSHNDTFVYLVIRYPLCCVGCGMTTSVIDSVCLEYCYIYHSLPSPFVCFRSWFLITSAFRYMGAARTAGTTHDQLFGTNVWVYASRQWVISTGLSLHIHARCLAHPPLQQQAYGPSEDSPYLGVHYRLSRLQSTS